MTTSATTQNGVTTIGSGAGALSFGFAAAAGGSSVLTMSTGGKQLGYFQNLTSSQTSVLKAGLACVASLSTVDQNLVIGLFEGLASASQSVNLSSYLSWMPTSDQQLIKDLFALVNEGTSVPAVTDLGSGAGTIDLYMAQTAGKANAQFTVSVDGKQVGGVQTVKASQGLGQEQLFELQGITGSGQHSVTVNFLNGSGTAASPAPQLFLDAVAYNGVAVANASLSLTATGSKSFTVGTKPSGVPTAVSGSLSVSENSAATPMGIAAPSDTGYAASSLSVTVGALPTDGMIVMADGKTAVSTGQVLTVAQLGGLEFVATGGAFDRTSTFAYTVADPGGATAQGSETLSIGKAVGNPVAASASLSVAENSGASPIGIVLPTDPNYASSSLTVLLGGLPTDGSVTLSDGVTAVAAGEVLTAAQLAGLDFTPAAGAFDQSSVLGYTVTDPDGNASAGSATLSIGHAMGNPVAVSQTDTFAVNAPATAIGIAAPTDPNYAASSLSVSVSALPTDGTVTLADGTTPVASGQQLTVAQLAGLEFTPATDSEGQSSVFGYQVTDPSGNTAQGTATLSTAPGRTYNLGDGGGTITTVGADTVNVGAGNATIYANGPSATAIGGSGQMVFIGSTGNDTIVAGSGYSGVVAGSGGLNYTAGTGDATVTANPLGHEVYNLVNGQAGGSLAIFGFASGQDVIHLVGYGSNAVVSEQQVPGAHLVSLSDNTRIDLPSFTPDATHPIFG